MKFSILTFATLFAALAAAAPAPEAELVARQCSCHKIGDEWLCSGKLCPKDFIPTAAMTKRDTEIQARGCSCKPIGNGEYFCIGSSCP
ncbi:hypothetical protein COL5a_004653 [Colletotrichum fioriniae]|uniref:Uncharacterized protein n=1 Tax=Colletotrichum fioriniae PJ7 TaxID=1445577 RepID=A0A010R7S5_9PEZI|nr:hypothetical protein CFIO01_07372 [Colletotrichum fioriniae PJ7]KAJ0328865.1 hypothetical protein COL5a_004653 [Colletotrichum fioriniae]KAJ3940409.1 hypothetical protein N0V96_009406 [Colletotrichum fioriniae]